MPLPDLAMREWVVAHLEPFFKAKGNHFTFFEYPKLPINQPLWEMGDHKAHDYVIIRSYGIEYGRQTWYDGLVYSVFVSFENFLHRPDFKNPLFTEEITNGIKEYLSKS